jgi:NAD(P)-dependent dehydrogenase (short-subunit alcohol dehydrogenase family)
MELENTVCVVTGGASGIGRSLATALGAAGARGVVVADLDEGGAREVADALGAAGSAMRCDVGDAAQVSALVDHAEERFGPVDLFCANAGVGVGTDPVATSPEEWALALDVNVLAHVHAARRLLPGWLERGRGAFLSTASAAGLLTQIGSAPYAVSKHAAVAFAEWLAVTYGARGIHVSCLCPMGVRTGMLEGEDNRAAKLMAAVGEILDPDDVARTALDALREERFLVLPHPEVQTFLERKASDYERWIGGMRRLQAAADMA